MFLILKALYAAIYIKIKTDLWIQRHPNAPQIWADFRLNPQFLALLLDLSQSHIQDLRASTSWKVFLDVLTELVDDKDIIVQEKESSRLTLIWNLLSDTLAKAMDMDHSGNLFPCTKHLDITN